MSNISAKVWFFSLQDGRRTTRTRSRMVGLFLTQGGETDIKEVVRLLIDDAGPNGDGTNVLNEDLDGVEGLPEVVARWFDYGSDNAVERFCSLGEVFQTAIISHLVANPELHNFAVELLKDEEARGDFIDRLHQQPVTDIEGLNQIFEKFATEASDGERMSMIDELQKCDDGTEEYAVLIFPVLVRADSDTDTIVFVIEHWQPIDLEVPEYATRAANILIGRNLDADTLIAMIEYAPDPFDERAFEALDRMEQSQSGEDEGVTSGDLEVLATVLLRKGKLELAGRVSALASGIAAAEEGDS